MAEIIKHNTIEKHEEQEAHLIKQFKEKYPDLYVENEEIINKVCSLIIICSDKEIASYIYKRSSDIINYTHILQTIVEEYSSLNVNDVLSRRLKESNSSSKLGKMFNSGPNSSNIQFDELEIKSILNRTHFYYNRTHELQAKCLAKQKQIILLKKFLEILSENKFRNDQIDILDVSYSEISILISQVNQTIETLKSTLDSSDAFININLPLISKVRELKSDVVNINKTLSTSYFDNEDISVLENLNPIIKSRIKEFRDYNYFNQLQDIFRLCNKKNSFFNSLMGNKSNSDLALTKTLELEQKIGYFSTDLKKLLMNAENRKNNVDIFFNNLNDEHVGKDSLLGLITKGEQLITEVKLILHDIETLQGEISTLKITIIKNK